MHAIFVFYVSVSSFHFNISLNSLNFDGKREVSPMLVDEITKITECRFSQFSQSLLTGKISQVEAKFTSFIKFRAPILEFSDNTIVADQTLSEYSVKSDIVFTNCIFTGNQRDIIVDRSGIAHNLVFQSCTFQENTPSCFIRPSRDSNLTLDHVLLIDNSPGFLYSSSELDVVTLESLNLTNSAAEIFSISNSFIANGFTVTNCELESVLLTITASIVKMTDVVFSDNTVGSFYDRDIIIMGLDYAVVSLDSISIEQPSGDISEDLYHAEFWDCEVNITNSCFWLPSSHWFYDYSESNSYVTIDDNNCNPVRTFTIRMIGNIYREMKYNYKEYVPLIL